MVGDSKRAAANLLVHRSLQFDELGLIVQIMMMKTCTLNKIVKTIKKHSSTAKKRKALI